MVPSGMEQRGSTLPTARLAATTAREDMSDSLMHARALARTFLSAIDELSRVEALCGYEELLSQAVPVRVPEDDPCKRSTSPGVVNDLLHNALDVPVSLRVVGDAQSRGSLAVLRVGSEYAPATLPLLSDDAPHVPTKKEHHKIDVYNTRTPNNNAVRRWKTILRTCDHLPTFFLS